MYMYFMEDEVLWYMDTLWNDYINLNSILSIASNILNGENIKNTLKTYSTVLNYILLIIITMLCKQKKNPTITSSGTGL